jgi:predicted secreted Zn-dependent protease
MHTMEIITDAGDDLYIAIDDNTDTSGTTGIVVGNSYSVTYTTDAAGNMTAVSIADAQ